MDPVGYVTFAVKFTWSDLLLTAVPPWRFQMSGDPDMLLNEYDAVDEKPEVADIHPDDPAEEAESEPLADDFDLMKSKYLPLLPDLDVEDEQISTWRVENYRSLQQKERGPTFTCGGHPWRILLFPTGNNVDFASLYLEQGREEGDQDQKLPEGWAACVQFTLVLWNENDPSILVHHTANHRFNAEESDWGFTRFAELRKLFAPTWEGKSRPMVENEAVNITAYVRTYKDPTGVLWHNFFNYNSKKETGMVGLKNQGATCYLNSLLQSLYFTDAFRKAIYQIPTEHESDRAKSAWALQRLFYLLQTNNDAVSTQELTQSFGWETKHIFEQQDVQELSRILMERMEERMKGTDAENALAKMFVGKMKTYISCINVNYESSRIEDFWDIQLNVSGNKNLDDSFKDYIQVETMDGENKYFAEGHGLQDAKKGVIFESFPQVLNLQLKRFEYDLNRDAMMKVNDRYEFPEVFDATPYLSETADKSESYLYNLHSVLVHSGDFNAGHYYAFLRPSAEGQFYKFDDDRVTRATNKEAMDENFGGDYAKGNNVPMRNPYTRTFSTKRSMSAYMLVYIRQSRMKSILHGVSESDSPSHLAKQLEEERAALEKKRKDREEQHLYLLVQVVTESNFKAHEGFDLTSFDSDNETPSRAQDRRVLKTSTIADLQKSIAEEQNLPPNHIRLWVMVNRQNKTVRPDQPLEDGSMTIESAYVKHGARDRNFRLWAEQASVIGEDGSPVWSDTQTTGKTDAPILIFLKHFDAEKQSLFGVGHIYLHKQAKVSDMFPLIMQKMGWTETSSQLANGLMNGASQSPILTLYEEIKSSMIEPMKPKATLQHAEIQDGDIVCFQKLLPETQVGSLASTGNYTDAREFYDYLLNRKTVGFSPRFQTERNEGIFKLDLSKKMSYEQFSAKVGEYLKVDPTHIRFATVNSTTGKVKALVRRTGAQTLSQILNPTFGTYGNSNQRDDALFYEVLDMSLSELDTKKNLKVIYMTEGQSKEESFDILVPKLGNVGDLVSGLARKAQIPHEDINHVRIYEINSGRIHREYRNETNLQNISEHSTLIAEIIPEEERTLDEEEFTVVCLHYDKEPNKSHGVPFKFVVKPGELFKTTKERLSRRIGLKGKQFDKIKFSVIPRSIYSKIVPLDEENILSDEIQSQEDYLGLDHVNRHKGLGTRVDSIFIR